MGSKACAPAAVRSLITEGARLNAFIIRGEDDFGLISNPRFGATCSP